MVETDDDVAVARQLLRQGAVELDVRRVPGRQDDDWEGFAGVRHARFLPGGGRHPVESGTRDPIDRAAGNKSVADAVEPVDVSSWLPCTDHRGVPRDDPNLPMVARRLGGRLGPGGILQEACVLADRVRARRFGVRR